jgi:hypothetical protein
MRDKFLQGRDFLTSYRTCYRGAEVPRLRTCKKSRRAFSRGVIRKLHRETLCAFLIALCSLEAICKRYLVLDWSSGGRHVPGLGQRPCPPGPGHEMSSGHGILVLEGHLRHRLTCLYTKASMHSKQSEMGELQLMC